MKIKGFQKTLVRYGVFFLLNPGERFMRRACSAAWIPLPIWRTALRPLPWLSLRITGEGERGTMLGGEGGQSLDGRRARRGDVWGAHGICSTMRDTAAAVIPGNCTRIVPPCRGVRIAPTP